MSEALAVAIVLIHLVIDGFRAPAKLVTNLWEERAPPRRPRGPPG